MNRHESVPVFVDRVNFNVQPNESPDKHNQLPVFTNHEIYKEEFILFEIK